MAKKFELIDFQKAKEKLLKERAIKESENVIQFPFVEISTSTSFKQDFEGNIKDD